MAYNTVFWKTNKTTDFHRCMAVLISFLSTLFKHFYVDYHVRFPWL